MWSSSDRLSELPPNWAEIRAGVLKEDNYVCQIKRDGCLIAATDVDHIRRGSDHSRSNLTSACGWCHDRKSAAEGHARKRELKAQRKRPVERHPGSR